MYTEIQVDTYLKIFNAVKLNNLNKKIDRYKGVWPFCIVSKAYMNG